MDMDAALKIAASGMQAQAARLRVVAENIANADTTGGAPGAAPYRRRMVTFADRLDHASGVTLVGVSKVGEAVGDSPLKYDPSHPAADARGYVKMPNVDPFIESMDMKAAERGYAANVAVMQATRGILSRTLDLLRG